MYIECHEICNVGYTYLNNNNVLLKGSVNMEKKIDPF